MTHRIILLCYWVLFLLPENAIDGGFIFAMIMNECSLLKGRDEFEALRLADLEEMKQEEVACLMKVSRPTFSRIVASARKKIADGLVNIKAIRIEGGCCKIIRGGTHE